MDPLYVYTKRYNENSIKFRLNELSSILKKSVLKGISKTPFRNKLYFGDRYLIKKEPSERALEDERIYYSDITFPKVKYFEVFNIDDFDKYRPLLLKHLKDEGPRLFKPTREKLENAFQAIKDSLNTISYDGDVAYMQFDKSDSDDLIKHVSIGYIKTRESAFILTVDVTTSQKFQDQFAAIIKSKDIQIEELIFNDLKTIIRTGIFIKHSAIHASSIGKGISDLIGDLNHQIKKNLTNKLGGTFSNSKDLPRIEYFEINSMEDFSKDKFLAMEIGYRDADFSLSDKKIKIVTSYNFVSSNRFRIIKEKGHGKKINQSPNDLTDYDWVETYELSQALSLPCSLSAILGNQVTNLTKLKREIYDYITASANRKFYQNFTIFSWKKKYERLKIKLALSILTFKRFEEEFDNKNLNIYFHHYSDLKMFIQNDSNSIDNMVKGIDLETSLKETFKRQIEGLNREIGILEHVFKPIEDLHVYRLNIWLQMTSLLIAILAFIFAFEKVQGFISHLVNFFKTL